MVLVFYLEHKKELSVTLWGFLYPLQRMGRGQHNAVYLVKVASGHNELFLHL